MNIMNKYDNVYNFTVMFLMSIKIKLKDYTQNDFKN